MNPDKKILNVNRFIYCVCTCACTNASIKATHSIQQVSQHSSAERTASLLHARHGAPLVSPSVIHVNCSLSKRTVEAPDCVHTTCHGDHTWTHTHHCEH